MRLRLRRSQRSSGVLTSKTMFRLEARADITAEEHSNIKKYKMGKEVVYSRERVAADRSGEASWSGIARNLAAYATALTIRIDDLIQGTAIECKDILEMLAVEEQITEACKTFKNILDATAHFDGEEVIEV